MENYIPKLPPLFIAYVYDPTTGNRGWRITEVGEENPPWHTPQSFEAEYGYLPPLSKKIPKYQREEYYKHQKKKPPKKGFGN